MSRVSISDQNKNNFQQISAADAVEVVSDWDGTSGTGGELVNDAYSWGTTKNVRLDTEDDRQDATMTAIDLSSASKSMAVKVYNSNTVDLNLRIYVTSDVFAHYALVDVAVPPGEHVITIPPRFCWRSLSGFDWTTHGKLINRVRIKRDALAHQSSISAAGGYLDVGPIYFGIRARAIILLSHDDSITTAINDGAGYPTGYPASGGNVKDIVEYYGLKANFGIIAGTNSINGWGDTRRLNESNQLTDAEVRTLAEAGHCLLNHANANWAGRTNSEGLTMLGPKARNIAIASVNTTTNTFTTSADHPFKAGIPIDFTGTDFPAEITSGAVYYIYNVAATTFQLCPTYADALAGTNVIALTTGGTPSNYLVHHVNAASDETAIQAALLDCSTYLNNLGVTHYADKYLVSPQGGFDWWVAKACRNLGITYARGTTATSEYVCQGHGSPPCINGDQYTDETDNYYPSQPWAMNIDSSGAKDLAIAAIDDAIQAGCALNIYVHGLTADRATYLDEVCQEIVKRQKAGEIECLTVDEYIRIASQSRRIDEATGRVAG